MMIHDPGVWIGKALTLSPWRPTLDRHSKKPVLPESPDILLAKNDYEKLPVMIGTTSDESVSAMSTFLDHPVLFANFTETLPSLLFGKPRKDLTERDNEISNFIKRY